MIDLWMLLAAFPLVGMAYALQNWVNAPNADVPGPLPGNVKTVADQTATSAAQAMAAGFKTIRAVVYVKTYVVGTATVGPIFDLLAADNSGMTTNLTVLATITGKNVASGTETQCYVLTGAVPIAAKAYAQIAVTLNGSATIAYDALIQAV